MKTKLLLAALICGSATMFASDLKQGQLSNVTRVTSDKAARYENPVWSPDGQQIAFNTEGYNGLYLLNPKTKAVKTLSTDNGIGYMMQWSADGHEILVRDTRWISTASGVSRTHAAFSINTANGNKIRLSDDAADLKPAAWRYDAKGRKTIVCNAKVRPMSLAAVPAARLGVKNAAAPKANCGISFVEDFENLYVVDQTGNKRILYAGPAFNAQLSPDGTKVVFNAMDDIYVCNLDGSAKRKLAVGFRPQWAGNSQIIYERTSDNGHTYTAGDLYILNIAGGTEKALTQSRDRIEMFPAVSPDGSKIAFVSNTDGQLYIADLK